MNFGNSESFVRGGARGMMHDDCFNLSDTSVAQQ